MNCASLALRNQAVGKLHNYELCRSLKMAPCLVSFIWFTGVFALILAFYRSTVFFSTFPFPLSSF